MIKTALIGYGSAAQTFHRPFINAASGLRLDAIVSSKPGLPAASYADTQSLLENADIELAVITTPNHTHYPLAKQCLLAGKHVVLEKPMTLTHAEGEELYALARANGVLLTVYHNRRLDGDYLTVQKLLRDKRLGTIRTFRSHWDRYRPAIRQRWREDGSPGSGIWYDLAPHMLDQTLQLFGMPEALEARIRALRPGSRSPDYAHVQLHYPECEIILHTSPYSAAPTARYVIEGDAATFVKYGLDPQEAQLKSGMNPQDPAFGKEAPEQYGILYHGDGTQETIPTERGRFSDYYTNLAAAIRGETAPAIRETEALAVMRLLELATDSAAQGKTLQIT